jgi:3'(2'), 5'-bisphosphate nucleotidase
MNLLTPSVTDELVLRSFVPPVLALASQASNAIMKVYHGEVAVETSEKEDFSPVTAADIAAHNVIVKGLQSLSPDIPVLSEEGQLPNFDERQCWSRYWLIDPLDGTKEFLNRNDEFTVNIALIERGYPILGVVMLPVSGMTYYGFQGGGAYCVRPDQSEMLLKVRPFPLDKVGIGAGGMINVLASRRHGSEKVEQLMAFLRRQFSRIDCVQAGSSLKFCRVAEGVADLYPRFAPTCEWDTAAAQAIVEAAGGHVVDICFERLRYNSKASLLNPDFYVMGDNLPQWQQCLSSFFIAE